MKMLHVPNYMLWKVWDRQVFHFHSTSNFLTLITFISNSRSPKSNFNQLNIYLEYLLMEDQIRQRTTKIKTHRPEFFIFLIQHHKIKQLMAR